jgi:transcriptional regulator with XRE-family HTH domain
MSDLKWLRENYKMAQAEVAEELGIDETAYALFESGKGLSRLDMLSLKYKKMLVAQACVAIDFKRKYVHG